MVHHYFARSQLPARAIKVGLFVLSHDHGYVLTQEQIGARIKLNVDTVRAALKDLEDAELLVRVAERNASGHRTGTALHVSDVPFTAEEVAELVGTPTGKTPTGKNPCGKSPGPKKTTSKQETKTPEDQPSGGATVPAAPIEDVPSTTHPEERSEDPMPRAKPSKDTPALFDVERPPSPPAPFSAGTVVGAYVTSYQALHDGVRPTSGTIGQVSRAAKALIVKGEATEDELLAAAVELGRTAFANLDRQVMMARRSTRGSSRVDATGSATWEGADEEMRAQADALVAEDPEMAAWMAGDQAQVSA